jgi:hypothetical protein
MKTYQNKVSGGDPNRQNFPRGTEENHETPIMIRFTGGDPDRICPQGLRKIMKNYQNRVFRRRSEPSTS